VKLLLFLLSSVRKVVSRVVSEHMIELDVIDLIGCLSGETALNDGVLFFRDPHLEVVEDRPEASESDEASSGAVLVLEVRLDQQSSVCDICSESGEAGNENSLLSLIEDILRVEDGGGLPLSDGLCWVLFEVWVGENEVSLFHEVDVVHQFWVLRGGEVLLEGIKFGIGQVNPLSEEGASEFGSWNISLAENIVVLEEFEESDSVL